MNEPNKPGFDTPWKGGFHITFENGNTVSVQFRAGNYCEHHDKIDVPLTDIDSLYKGRSADAEMAAWDKDGNWITRSDWSDSVKGWNSPAEVLEFMNYVASLQTKEREMTREQLIQQIMSTKSNHPIAQKMKEAASKS